MSPLETFWLVCGVINCFTVGIIMALDSGFEHSSDPWPLRLLGLTIAGFLGLLAGPIALLSVSGLALGLLVRRKFRKSNNAESKRT
jgi:hypothetical protein